MNAEFIHLHNHSEYSLLDGMLKISEGGKPSEFLKSLVAKGVPAFAITDHGNMFGAVEFYFAAQKIGLKPIIGCEMYLAKGKLTEQNEQKENNHLTVLAENFEGYQNLMLLNSIAFNDGYYYKPRIDLEILEKHAKGLIVLSGCLQGPVAKLCLKGDIKGAIETAGRFKDIFGKDNYFIELMDHNIADEQTAMKGLLEVAKACGLETVATNDCHYPQQKDWQAHDVHLCISTGKTLNDTNRLKMETPELYVKSVDEMKKLFAHTPKALSNTVLIAERCNFEIPHGKNILPVFPLPKEAGTASHNEYLKSLCIKGLKSKLETESIPNDYANRMEFELEIINRMGFPSYFLIVSDFINHARSKGIPVGPGRGSGAGSLVSYSLDITRVDPIVNGLLFERFLNPDRISMPDLDIDFSDEGRAEVVEYVKDKYGRNNVANIITYGTIKAKLAVKDVARVLDYPIEDANKLSKLIPDGLSLAQALEESEELKQAAKETKVQEILGYAKQLEGLRRHTGVHAAGIVITKEEVYKYTPLARGQRDVMTSQYEGTVLDKLGLLKMDFLGLRTLTIIDNAVKLIKKHRNIDLDINKIPLTDEKTFELLQEGKTTCIFQLESSGMKDLVRALKPTAFSDISALVALYRPGPMKGGMLETFVNCKHGRQEVKYEHPLMEPVLKETYGTMVYQEQVMNIAKSLAGFTPGKADYLRKAMGKKIAEAMQECQQEFVTGCAKNKIPQKLAEKIFDQMAKFAEYGFNKSHSVAYALVSYQTAYLKANYPIEFMTAALTSEIGHSSIGVDDKENKVITYINEAKNMGMQILPPCIAKSEADFSIEKTKDGTEAIRFGLSAIKNIGTEVAEEFVRIRKLGPFKSPEDMCLRLESRQINKKTWEALGKAGALDCLFPGFTPALARAVSLREMEHFARDIYLMKQEVKKLEDGLFGADNCLTESCAANRRFNTEGEPLSEHEMLAYEKEMLDMYFSGHPLVRYEKQIKMLVPHTIHDIVSGKISGPVKVAAIINGVTKKQTKNKDTWAQMKVEDLTDVINANMFPRAYSANAAYIKPSEIILIEGNVKKKTNENGELMPAEITAEKITPIFQAISQNARNISIHIDNNISEDSLIRLSELFEKYRGEIPVYFLLKTDNKRTLLLETMNTVSPDRELFEAVSGIVGEKAWRVESKLKMAAAK